jgi:hypothetical protein
MLFARWITKTRIHTHTHTHTRARARAHTHTQYVIVTAFPRQQWLRERTSMLRYTDIACHPIYFMSHRLRFSIWWSERIECLVIIVWARYKTCLTQLIIVSLLIYSYNRNSHIRPIGLTWFTYWSVECRNCSFRFSVTDSIWFVCLDNRCVCILSKALCSTPFLCIRYSLFILICPYVILQI